MTRSTLLINNYCARDFNTRNSIFDLLLKSNHLGYAILARFSLAVKQRMFYFRYFLHLQIPHKRIKIRSLPITYKVYLKNRETECWIDCQRPQTASIEGKQRSSLMECCSAAPLSLSMQRGNQGHRAKNRAHVARDAFSQRCDRTDGVVGCRGEFRRPCRFPIKQMPAGNSSNPSGQGSILSLSLCISLSPSLSLSFFFVRSQKGNRRSARVWQHAKFESKLAAGDRVRVYVRPIFQLVSALHARESLAAGALASVATRACNHEHADGIPN